MRNILAQVDGFGPVGTQLPSCSSLFFVFGSGLAIKNPPKKTHPKTRPKTHKNPLLLDEYFYKKILFLKMHVIHSEFHSILWKLKNK